MPRHLPLYAGLTKAAVHPIAAKHANLCASRLAHKEIFHASICCRLGPFANPISAWFTIFTAAPGAGKSSGRATTHGRSNSLVMGKPYMQALDHNPLEYVILWLDDTEVGLSITICAAGMCKRQACLGQRGTTVI